MVFKSLVVGCVVSAPLAAAAQTPDVTPRPQTSQQRLATMRQEAEARQQRYQIGLLERVIESAVEHGVTVTRDRLQELAQAPADLVFSDNAHARGFRLDGYGVFIDVSVPSFEASWWALRLLDQNDLGLDSAMKELQTLVKNSGNVNAEQALKRVELQVGPSTFARATQQQDRSLGAPRLAAGSTASTNDPPAGASAHDPILNDPNEAYRTEVIQALKDAMLDHSSSLGIEASEWLTIAARGNDDRPRLAPADGSSRTRMLRLRGSDLNAYLAKQITKEEALNRIEVKVF